MKKFLTANLISLLTALAAVWACWNKQQEINMTKWKAKNFQEFTEQHYELKQPCPEPVVVTEFRDDDIYRQPIGGFPGFAPGNVPPAEVNP